MFTYIIFLTVLFVGGNCRYVLVEDYIRPLHFVEDTPIETVRDYGEHPVVFNRPRVRRSQGSVTYGSDGVVDTNVKVPITRDDNNILSATSSMSSNKISSSGLVLDNLNGHSLSFSERNIPDFGNQITAAGRANLLHTDKHDLNANAFATRNMPKFDSVPDFNTFGGGLDYTYNNKIGASLNAARTDFLKRTDVSAMGNLNLFRNPTNSIDFSAGASRSFSPYIPNSSWEPKFGLTFTKSW